MSAELTTLPVRAPAQAPLVSFADMQQMAIAVAKSNLFGMTTPDQALALMLVAQAEGLHPGIVARDYHIIQGRAALKADAMLARFQQAGGTVQWYVRSDEICVAEFSHKMGGKLVIRWDKARAEKAGLWGKQNWKTYPAQMLSARCISEGVRAVYPSVASGVYTPEELQDLPTEKVPRIIVSVQEKPQARLLADNEVDDWLAGINLSQDVAQLKKEFTLAYKDAKGRGDTQRMATFKSAYDIRKAILEEPAPQA